MKKKFLAILLALGLVITCMPMVALAEGSGLSVDKTEVKKGETVRVTLTLPSEIIGNLGVLEFKLIFNNTVLKVTKIGANNIDPSLAGNTSVSTANQNGWLKWSYTGDDENGFEVDNNVNLYADFEVLSEIENTDFEISECAIEKIDTSAGPSTNINLAMLPSTFNKSVTLQLKGTDGGKTLTKDAHIKGNVLDVAEEYNVVIIYNDDAVYTYIPNDAKDSDINKTYQNAENGVTLSPTDKETVRGKWCGYGDGVDNVGFDGNKNRITIINGMDVAGTVTATAAKDAGIKGETFSINLTTSDEVDGSANYAILRDACITGSTEEQLNAAFNQCGSSDKFGKRTISTGGFSLGAINTQGNTIKYANIYYSLTGDPGTGMANWGGYRKYNFRNYNYHSSSSVIKKSPCSS